MYGLLLTWLNPTTPPKYGTISIILAMDAPKLFGLVPTKVVQVYINHIQYKDSQSPNLPRKQNVPRIKIFQKSKLKCSKHHDAPKIKMLQKSKCS